ncbi:hypothetical protein KFE98_02755 [bacterium SCSIO 12741]|nr:hypothetical protein KFE98_02755 [bacterium SCSIO 12741]
MKKSLFILSTICLTFSIITFSCKKENQLTQNQHEQESTHESNDQEKSLRTSTIGNSTLGGVRYGDFEKDTCWKETSTTCLTIVGNNLPFDFEPVGFGSPITDPNGKSYMNIYYQHMPNLTPTGFVYGSGTYNMPLDPGICTALGVTSITLKPGDYIHHSSPITVGDGNGGTNHFAFGYARFEVNFVP